ncbi:WhiB family transcriptional regulator [Micromonospora carbonacea]|uniref:Transcription factor WhiB n=1 Tax=Micromonospora carbonacea TaxID=47853 RepID=A0A1C5AYV0_9ACTN|nr:WhiB family transcriptional regulator [Micromonospora carbonacea]SCF50390.1 Transcription factor WhiB [Micromonospora carbonacea]
MTTPLLTSSTDRDWRRHGNCTASDVNMHPDDSDHRGEQAAKKVCAGCPVATQCLVESINLSDWHGIRAGLTGGERRNLDAQRTPRRCARCRDVFVPRVHNQIRCRPCARANDLRGRR